MVRRGPYQLATVSSGGHAAIDPSRRVPCRAPLDDLVAADVHRNALTPAGFRMILQVHVQVRRTGIRAADACEGLAAFDTIA